jgi:acylphosphatase
VEHTSPEPLVRLTARVQGYVQGVGFRWSTMALAQTMKLVGVAENLPNGDVLVIAEGPEHSCQTVLDWLQGKGPRTVRRPGRVEFVDARWGPAEGGFRSFTCR